MKFNIPLISFQALFRKPWLGAVILTIVAWLGNVFHLPLFFGVDFLFGSIAVMVILYFYGFFFGMAGAIVAGSYTYLLWGHPWAALILVLEALWVGLGLRRGYRNLLLLDLAYWIPTGMFLVWIFYGQVLHLPPTGAFLIALKQSLNGIFNALVANLIVNAFSSSLFKVRIKKTSLQQIVFVLLAFFTITPLLIATIVTGRQNIQEMELQIESNLSQTGKIIAQEIRTWYNYNQLGLVALGQSIATLNPQSSEDQKKSITNYLATTQFILPGLSTLYITDADGIILAIVPELNDFKKMVNTSVAANKLWQQARQERQPVFSNVLIDEDYAHSEMEIAVPILKGLGFQGVVYGIFELSEVDNILDNYLEASNIEAIVLDLNQQKISSNIQQGPLSLKGGKIIPRGDRRFHWLPDLPGKPIMTRWRKSFYVQELDVSPNLPWTLRVKISASPYIDRLEILYIRSLGLLVLMLVIALPLVAVLSRRLTRPILQLAQMSTDLPAKLRENTAFVWPQTEVNELALLTQNFQGMVATIRSQFATIEGVNSQLEERVLERTIALQESEQRFRQFAEQINSVFWITDPGKNAMLYVSPAYEAIWGKSCESLYANPLSFVESIVEDDRERIIKAFPRQLMGQYDEEYRIKRSTGEIRWIHDRVFPIINDRGEVYRVVGIAEDVTERKQTEAEMAAAKQAADAASRAKSDFLATMSHELRTPMNAVIGMTELLLDSPLNNQQQQFLNIIYNSGEALLTLITDILDFSRIEADRIELENSPFDLRSLLEESLDLITAKATAKHLEIFYLLPNNCPSWIQGDVNRLQQILGNLLGNAVKFTEGGHIILQVQYQPTQTPQTDRLASPDSTLALPIVLEFSVIDTGIGIPTDKLDRLFKPFSQVDASTTRMYGGTGLGLAICHRLVQMMGGTIDVDTELGLGSRFYFTIQTVPVSPPSSIDRSLLPVKHKRILIIDSSPTAGKMLRLQAESLDMETVTATDALQGLGLIETHPPFDMLLLSWKTIMDDPDNWHKKIQNTAHNQGYYLPIIHLSDMVNPSCTPDALSIKNCWVCFQPQDCLVKPIKRSHLVERLIEVWSRPIPDVINLPLSSSSSGSSIAAVMDSPRLEPDPDHELDSSAEPPEPLILRVESPPLSSVPENLSSDFATLYPWRILLAEDNLVNQMVAIAMLQRLGYTVDVANNGLEVLALLNQQLYDVILMDLQMPELDGVSTAQRICQEFATEQHPWMIAMTANVMQGIVQECYAAGLKDYISKPVQLPILAAALSRVLR